MFLGSFRLGETVPLSVNTVNGVGTPTAPTNPPTARVMEGSTLVKSFSMPLSTDTAPTGLFARKLFLDSDFSEGVHEVVYQWTISGTTYQALQRFVIVAGGDDNGAVTTIYPYNRPDSALLVHSTSSGSLEAARNPR